MPEGLANLAVMYLASLDSYLEDFGQDEFDLAVRRRRARVLTWRSGGGEQIDDVLNGFVGAVVGSFKLAIWAVLRVGSVVEAAVGKRSAQPLVEEEKEQGDLDAFAGEAIGVAGAVAFDAGRGP